MPGRSGVWTALWAEAAVSLLLTITFRCSPIHDVLKVQVYCAWAEVLLGEAEFSPVVK